MERMPLSLRVLLLAALALIGCRRPDMRAGAGGAGTVWLADGGVQVVGGVFDQRGAGASLTGDAGVAYLNVPTGANGSFSLTGGVTSGTCNVSGGACSTTVASVPIGSLPPTVVGPGPSCLSSQQWLLPCTSGGTLTCTTTGTSSTTNTCIGDSATTYYVTLRFRGVVEPKIYTGGTYDGATPGFNVDGTPDGTGANIYKLVVSNPSHTYYLNAVPSGWVYSSCSVYAIDFTKTIPIVGGASVTLSALSVDGSECRNNASTGGPLSVGGITSPAQPYDGQFTQVDVGAPGSTPPITSGSPGTAHQYMISEGTSVSGVGPCAVGQPPVGNGSSSDPSCGTVSASYQAAQNMGGTSQGLTYAGTTGAVTTSGQLTIAGGGTGQTTQQAAIDALTGTQSSGKYLRSDGTHATLASIVAGDVPTLNQNTSGSAASLSATLPIGSGGTGQTTRAAAFNGLAPASAAQGDVMYFDGSNWVRLAAGTSGQFLETLGASANPQWATGTGGSLVPVYAGTATDESTTSTSYTNLTTTGPAVTVTVGASGKILVTLGATMYISSGTSQYCLMTISGTGISAADGNAAVYGESGASTTTNTSVARTYQISGLSAGSLTVTAKYRVSGGTGHFYDRDLTVTPL